ncbi:MAG: DUF4215 domain-containing protein, partial [Candidatus Peribacteraceae bacterium]|nr:DUF4215 domain-containing protein [Candidatus Peribacteraceae bacterium]
MFFLLLLVAIGGVWTLRLQSGVFRAQSTTTSTLTAVADSFVSSTESTTALGAFNYNLQVSNYRPYSTTFMREIFVKFNTSGVDTTFLASAKLLLNLGEAASASNTILRVRMLTDSNDQWSETAITYANRPTGVSSNPEVTFSCNATLCANPSNTNRPTLEIDVTSLLQQISNQNGTASFQIDVISTTQVSGLLGFSSKDSATGLPPRLEITLRVPTCGDGIVTAARGEQCDDGNNIDTDACPNSCLLPRCGDGILQINEQCDDGNNTNDDGCSSTCAEEPCYGSDDPCCGNPDICCHYPDDEYCPLCGDGNLLTGIEECDDGNRIGGDGCRWNCTVETAASSAPPPSSSSSSSSSSSTSSSVSSSSKPSSSSSSQSSSSSV